MTCNAVDLVISANSEAAIDQAAAVLGNSTAKALCRESLRLRACFEACEDGRKALELLNAVENFDADAALVPAGLSAKAFRCAFFDMDSTLIVNECIDELADMLGIKEKVADITERSMRGELDFVHSLTERCALLAGAPTSIFEAAFKRIRLTEGVRGWIEFLHANGVKTYILSGGFTQFASRTARELGMTGCICNNLTVANGILTGEVTGPAGGRILDREGKRRAMEVIAALNGAQLSQCIAAGDGANDLDMIKAAGFGFAYHAKPVVAQAAPHKLVKTGFESAVNWFAESWTQPQL